MTVEDPPLLEVLNLSVTFGGKQRRIARRSARLTAVDDVTFTVGHGETLGLVGESGSGKSTIARALLRLCDIDSGSILLDGEDVTGITGRMLDFRRDVQAIFQDPYASLNPTTTIRDVVGEPFTVHHGMRGDDRDQAVVELLRSVGLDNDHLNRYPHEFSGGQRQRIAFARAIALQPKLIVCDEPVSALDVSTQSQVINLLEELQDRLGIAYLFIAHDLAVVRHISDRIAVMYLGKIVETGPAERVYTNPQHPYTRALLDAVPLPDPVHQRQRRSARPRTRLLAETTSTTMRAGCAFEPRCPQATDQCRTHAPAVQRLGDDGWATCHLVTTTNRP